MKIKEMPTGEERLRQHITEKRLQEVEDNLISKIVRLGITIDILEVRVNELSKELKLRTSV